MDANRSRVESNSFICYRRKWKSWRGWWQPRTAWVPSRNFPEAQEFEHQKLNRTDSLSFVSYKMHRSLRKSLLDKMFILEIFKKFWISKIYLLTHQGSRREFLRVNDFSNGSCTPELDEITFWILARMAISYLSKLTNFEFRFPPRVVFDTCTLNYYITNDYLSSRKYLYDERESGPVCKRFNGDFKTLNV